MKFLSTLTISALTWLAAGCAPDLSAGGEGGPTSLPVLLQVPHAAQTAAHEGVRRVEIRWNLPAGAQSLAYRERVQTDGQGGFSITPLEVLTGSPMPLDQFLLLQTVRAGFHYRYRDAAVRDADLLLQNYSVLSAGQPSEIAGRACLAFQLEREGQSSTRTTLHLDAETGLVLASFVHTLEGELVSSTEYESFQLGAPAQMIPHASSNQETPLELPLGADPSGLQPVLGFAPALPALLPMGFERQALSRILDPSGQPWLKATYTDGLEVVFFVMRRPAAALPAALDGQLHQQAPSPLVGASQSMTDGVRTGPADSTPGGRLLSYRAGGIQVLQADFPEIEAFVLGRVPKIELHWMLESVLP